MATMAWNCNWRNSYGIIVYMKLLKGVRKNEKNIVFFDEHMLCNDFFCV